MRLVNFWLLPLLSCLMVLSLLDLLSTLWAMTNPGFVELNPLAAALFAQHSAGFLLALLVKFLPLVPLSYMVFLDAKKGEPTRVRTLKLAAFVTLVGSVAFYTLVLANNLPQLLLTVAW